MFIEFWSIWRDVFPVPDENLANAFVTSCKFVSLKVSMSFEKLSNFLQNEQYEYLCSRAKDARTPLLAQFPEFPGRTRGYSRVIGAMVPSMWDEELLFDRLQQCVMPENEFMLCANLSSSFTPFLPEIPASTVAAVAGVCLIQCGSALATGCVVGDGYVLTNAHVLPSREAAARAVAIFDFEDLADIPSVLRMALDSSLPMYKLAPEDFFFISAPVPFAVPQGRSLDFCLVRVGARVNEGRQHRLQPIPLAADTPRVGQRVVVIGHPFGSVKRLSVGKVTQNGKAYFRYDVPTRPGSSGSCVLFEGRLCGLHHNSLAGVYNQAISYRAIANALLRAGVDLSPASTAPKNAACCLLS